MRRKKRNARGKETSSGMEPEKRRRGED